MAASGHFSTNGYDGRYLTFSWTEKSQNIEKNQTTISWTLAGAGGDTSMWYMSGNFKVIIANETVYYSADRIQLRSGTTVASGTYTFTHANDGTKSFTASAEAGIYSYAVNCSGSGTFTLDTIPRASQPSCVTWPEHTQNVGDFGGTISIHMNRNADVFTHTVRYAYGSLTGTIATGVTTGCTWTIPLSFMDLIPNDVRGSGTIYVDTYQGSQLIGTKYCGFTATVPASVKPTCTVQVLDATDYQAKYGNLVKGWSKLRVTVRGYSAYSSPIKAYNATANGSTYTAAEFTTGVITAAETTTVSATVKDKRERTSAAASASFSVLDYSAPRISALTVHRCDGDGTPNDQGDYIRAVFSAAVTPLNNKNSATYKLCYKKTSESSYQDITLAGLNNVYTATNYSCIFAAEGNSSYNVEVQVTDDFQTITRATSASTAFTLMNWGDNGTSMGIGKVAEGEKLLEVALDTAFTGDVYGRAMGLGNLPRILPYDDLDLYTSPGIYCVATDGDAVDVQNIPRQVAGRLIVTACTGQETGSNWDYREQLFLPHDMFFGECGWVRMVARKGSTQWEYGSWNSTALQAYPVNSIYISYTHESPAEKFGGAWTRISNAFLWGCDTSGNIGQTGGEKTHTLTLDELPTHHHRFPVAHTSSGSIAASNLTRYNSNNTTYSGYNATEATGGGAAHNNMPPYIQVAIWRRTA